MISGQLAVRRSSVPRYRSLLGLLFVLVAACQTIGPYDQRAYELATSAKVDALALVAKGTEPAESHAAEIASLRLEVDKAYEYAKGRPKNGDSTKQWAILRDPAGHSLGGFLKRWEHDHSLSQGFVTEAGGQISDAFDQVIELESGKSK